MKYNGIVEDWEEYKETIQSSEYMQRLTLRENERLFMQGYTRGFAMGTKETHSIDRFEVIDHTLTGEGRSYLQRGDLEVKIELQDEERTMKIFIK